MRWERLAEHVGQSTKPVDSHEPQGGAAPLYAARACRTSFCGRAEAAKVFWQADTGCLI